MTNCWTRRRLAQTLAVAPAASLATIRASRDATPAPVTDPWAALRRPWQLPGPSSDTDGTCSPLRPYPVPIEFAPILGGEPVLGSFPIFAKGQLTSLDTDNSFAARARKHPTSGELEAQHKTIWRAHPNYQGPILVRARRLDAAGPVSFNAGIMTNEAGDELRLNDANAGRDLNHPGWRLWGTTTIVQSAGCYAWQVDGSGFTLVIAFAVPA